MDNKKEVDDGEQSKKEQERETEDAAKRKRRRSTYAGTWYSSKKGELDKQISVWFESSKLEPRLNKRIKAIIAPHMGFSYSGAVSAAAYKYLSSYSRTRHIESLRVFVFGASHYFHASKCLISCLEAYESPYGPIQVDQEVIQKLRKDFENDFILCDRDAEEQEHSLELQLPFLAKCADKIPLKIIPIIIGSLDPLTLDRYTAIFSPFFEAQDSLFVISTDLCHWGSRFKYSQFNKDEGEIHTSIEKLDHEAIDLIERHDTIGFTKYLHETQNPICGRHGIEILLNLINASPNRAKLRTKLAKYGQSATVKEFSDSCVTYASLVTAIDE